MGGIELVGVAWVLYCYEAQKVNVRFEISTFEIGYKKFFDKPRTLILFDTKCPNWFRLKIFEIQISDLK